MLRYPDPFEDALDGHRALLVEPHAGLGLEQSSYGVVEAGLCNPTRLDSCHDPVHRTLWRGRHKDDVGPGLNGSR